MQALYGSFEQFLGYSILSKNLKQGLRLFYLPFIFIFSTINQLYVYTIQNFDLSLDNGNKEVVALNKYFYQKKKWTFLKNSNFFFFLDLIYLWIFKFVFSIHSNKFGFGFRIKQRINQVNWRFYNNLNLSNKNISFLFSHYLSGLRYLWIGLRYWILSLVVGSLIFYYLTYIRLLPFNKIIFEWVLLIMFYYWLVSGFTFFIKKYQFSKFTSVIQRFWKRSYILFWLIEGYIFLVFFFLSLNAAEEPTYMFDQMKLFKTHLFSWRIFLLKIVPVIVLMVVGYYLQLSLKWTTFTKQTPVLVVITLMLVYIFWLEFYQFFHIISYYGSLIWSYDVDEFLWNLDINFKRTRIVNNLTTICLLAKFWHLVFIFLFWVFFILRINEIGRVRYPLLAANLQNFIILYFMSWLYMFPWLKFAYRRHMETQYFWFFYSARRLGLRVFFIDLKLFAISILDQFSCNLGSSFKSGLFFYWIESSSEAGLLQYKKFIIRDTIITSLNTNNIVLPVTEILL